MTMLLLLLLRFLFLLLPLFLSFHMLNTHIPTGYNIQHSAAQQKGTYIHDVQSYGKAVDGVCGRRCP